MENVFHLNICHKRASLCSYCAWLVAPNDAGRACGKFMFNSAAVGDNCCSAHKPQWRFEDDDCVIPVITFSVKLGKYK